MNEQERISIGKIEPREAKAPVSQRARTEKEIASQGAYETMAARARRESMKAPPPVDGAKWIPLTRGLFALVDEGDYEKVRHRNWSAQKSVRTCYAVRGYRLDGKRKMDLLHRVIMDTPCGMQVDHIDGDGLNCRRSNMRNCTVKENHRNTRKPLSAKTSRFKGVYWMKQRNKWVAGIYYDNKRRTLGYFDNEIDAATRYNNEARLRFGEFALLNPV